MTNKPILYLHEKQMEVSKTKSRFKVVVAGRRWGKTQLAKTSIIKYAKVKNRLIWYVAPSYRMAKQIMWPELLSSVPRRWIKDINMTTLTITLVNKTRIELKGADNPDSLRGVGIHFLVMDEVQDIDPEAWTKVLRPTLASTGGHALFIGTPKAYNFLYELYILGQKQSNIDAHKWRSWQFPTMTSPFIPHEEIEAAKEDMDEKSFNQEFNACHLPETLIQLWCGESKAIKDISKGDLVTHITPIGERISAEVLQVGKTGEKMIMDAFLETGEIITASAHHKFKVHTCHI